MEQPDDTDHRARREYSQLLRLYERLLGQLQRVRDELDAPGTTELVKEIRRRTGGETERSVADVTSAVEEAMRTLKVSESEIQQALVAGPGDLAVDGVDNLPPTLARFLAERKQLPGFTFEVTQDEVRGWVIRWKEWSGNGVVRGCGQFYERPYAWLED